MAKILKNLHDSWTQQMNQHVSSLPTDTSSRECRLKENYKVEEGNGKY